MTKLSDTLLLVRLRRHDQQAFTELYDSYVAKIYRFIYFKVSSVEAAQDLTSEVFLKVWQYFTEGKQVKHLQAFIYQVARNLVIDHYRQKANQQTISTDDEGVAELPDTTVGVDITLQLSSDVEKLEEALRQLKDEYREVIVLRYLDGLSTGEVASILDKSKGNVRVLTHRAIEALREVMSKNNLSNIDDLTSQDE